MMTVRLLFVACLAASGPADGGGGSITTAGNETIEAAGIAMEEGADGLIVTYSLADGTPARLKAEDVVTITLHPKAAPAPKPIESESVELTLTSGDILTGRLGAPSDEGVDLVTPACGPVRIAFDRIRRILFPPGGKSIPFLKTDTDVVFLRSGDRAEGTLLTVSRDEVRYTSRRLSQEVALPIDRVAAVWMAEMQPPPPGPTGLSTTVLTTDRSSLHGRIRSFRDGFLCLDDAYGQAWKIPADSVASLLMTNGRVVYLSDLDPVSVREDANYIRGPERRPSDLDFPFQRDRSAKGTPLTIGTTEHRKGLGVRAHSELTYALDGAYRRFNATVGLDAVSRGLGPVFAEIRVDGKKTYERLFRNDTQPEIVDLDVSGARELTLVAAWAETGPSDFLDWGSARLVRP